MFLNSLGRGTWHTVGATGGASRLPGAAGYPHLPTAGDWLLREGWMGPEEGLEGV